MLRLIMMSLALGVACSTVARAADDGANYPTKPVTVTLHYSAGGASDALGRALARALEKNFKQPVPVENIPGGAGTRGVTAVLRAAPDGYQIGIATNSPMTIAVHSVKGLPWGAPDTYDIIGGIAVIYNVLCIQPDSEFKTLEAVVQFAKANPGKLKVASIAGGTNQYIWDKFVKQANINVRFVPYTGDAEGVASFLGANTELVNLTWPGMRAQIEAGKARPLAIFAPERLSSHPDVPTFKELGYDVTTTTDYVVYAPNGLPPKTRSRIVDALKEAVRDPDFEKLMNAQNIFAKFTDGAKMTEKFTEVFKSSAQLAPEKP
ncbi:MAG TPA: tripartite tricarboxylate transporter substrate binding protein [Pseudolabrys sp.]|nr:tripartite tricarboxylate transporter substrate binding protein [Pseudolabrys sp.]